jgi:microcystin-dependent protein
LPNPGKMSVTTPNWLFRPEQIDLDHDNMPPFACVNYIIATEGIFPSRP